MDVAARKYVLARAGPGWCGGARASHGASARRARNRRVHMHLRAREARGCSCWPLVGIRTLDSRARRTDFQRYGIAGHLVCICRPCRGIDSTRRAVAQHALCVGPRYRAHRAHRTASRAFRQLSAFAKEPAFEGADSPGGGEDPAEPRGRRSVAEHASISRSTRAGAGSALGSARGVSTSPLLVCAPPRNDQQVAAAGVHTSLRGTGRPRGTAIIGPSMAGSRASFGGAASPPAEVREGPCAAGLRTVHPREQGTRRTRATSPCGRRTRGGRARGDLGCKLRVVAHVAANRGLSLGSVMYAYGRAEMRTHYTRTRRAAPYGRGSEHSPTV